MTNSPTHPIDRRRRGLLLGALAAAGLVACSPRALAPVDEPASEPVLGSDPPTPRRGGVARIGYTGDAHTLLPHLAADAVSREFAGYLFESGMWRYDPHTLEPIPNMAERWEVSADKLTYTWHLNPALRWSDGKPLTSDDWQWTFQQLIDGRNGYAERDRLTSSIARLTAPDAHRVVVQITQPLAVGLELANPPAPLPRHVWERYDWRDAARNPEIEAPSVVSGPFRLGSRTPGQRTRFVANARYVHGRPLIDELDVRMVPDKSTGLEMFKRGEIDWGSRLVPPSALADALAHPLLRVYEWEPAGPTSHSLAFNLRRPAVSEVAVRQAVAFASNREAIRPFYNGLARPSYSNYAAPSWAYNPDVPRYEHDLDRAAQALDAAGWRLASGAKVRTRDGETLNLRLAFALPPGQTEQQPAGGATREVCEVCQPSGAHELTARSTQAALREIGVDVAIEGLDMRRFDQVLSRPPFDWDIALLGLGNTIDPHWSNRVWSTSGIPMANRTGYANARVDALYDQAAHEFDRDRRRLLYQEIQHLVATDLPAVFLAFSIDCMFLNRRVHPNPPTRLGIAYRPELWWLEDAA